MLNLNSHRWRLALLGLLCALPAAADELGRQAKVWMRADHVVLLGEVHDNPDGHAQRLALLKTALHAGWRPALVMEMFDRERQAELDAARQHCRLDGACIAQRAGAEGWNWALYQPVLALAQQYQLPLIAGNLSRDEARQVMKNGYAAVLDEATRQRYRLDQPLPAALEEGQRQALDQGHCGMLPAKAMPAMVRAQVARDVVLADTLLQHRSQGAVLIAGNGHVGRAVGVPRWLPEAVPLWVVGFIEQGQSASGYDLAVAVAATPREDPCLGLAAVQKP
ncbi:ChaN family lipoprotein [Craterilacuibacter sp. RT1T]|uniref:ChaN family lipoprotein n=1 Tax=Craterilacuibacter sp. RT1T TaxID=2942211 RepID=UPI0020BF40F4|nr:ChaN family lipoprotein [Craterilacuibacter sp. RT1T]MCL6262403.1 ChaN family lipoprotein [Craterilacuibacter sp. RT1T]